MLKHYLKMALKVLLRHKFFTFVSLFGISLTLTGIVPVAAYLDSILAATPPESRIDNILFVGRIRIDETNGGIGISNATYYFLNRYVRTLKTPKMVSIYSSIVTASLIHDDRKTTFAYKYTDANFWNILDFSFTEGRPFSATEVDQAIPVAVISEKMRSELFGAQSAIGKTVELEQQAFRIVGVVQTVNNTRASFADAWVPVTTSHGDFTTFRYDRSMFNAMLLAADHSDLDRIRNEYTAVLAKAELPANVKKITCPIRSNLELIEGQGGTMGETPTVTFLHKVLFSVLLFLLLPTVNLVNMNISRIMDRASEIAIRKSFGATSRSLVLQFLAENLVITFLGAIVGMALGMFALATINSSMDMNLALNVRVVLYYLLMTLFFGILSGVVPAMKMSRMKPVDGLQGAHR